MVGVRNRGLIRGALPGCSAAGGGSVCIHGRTQIITFSEKEYEYMNVNTL